MTAHALNGLPMKRRLALTATAALLGTALFATVPEEAQGARDPATVLWSTRPADKWENAYPVGNGRLGAMVFGKTDEEQVQLNEDTYWSGGPYSTVVKGGARVLPEIQKLVFEGNYKMAHILFGRSLMGYPVEQMKYQALANLVISFQDKGPAADYRRALDLDTAVVTTTYERNGIRSIEEVFSSPVDDVIVIRLTADRPGSVSFSAQLRGDPE